MSMSTVSVESTKKEDVCNGLRIDETGRHTGGNVFASSTIWQNRWNLSSSVSFN